MSASPPLDLIVVGAGSGGLATALRAAALGARTALVDPGAPGGTCVNRGCVPKKVMWTAARAWQQLALARAVGIGLPPAPVLDWSALVAARQAYIGRIQERYRQQLEEAGVAVHACFARRIAAGQVQLDDGRVLQAPHIVLATGARPRRPVLPAGGGQWLEDSDDVFAWNRHPASVAVAGGGYIGVEMASLLATLGCRTTLLVRDRLLPGFDAEVVEALAGRLRAGGVDLRFGVELEGLSGGPGRLHLAGRGDLPRQPFAHVLAAIGREPNSAGLGLEEAGVACDGKGRILVDPDTLATRVPGIWAVGDVTDQPALTPVAVAQGRRLAERLAGARNPPPLDLAGVPSVVFSLPPLGRVGLDEATARQRHGQVSVLRSRFRPLAAALADAEGHSLFKVVCAGPEERVVGLHLMGEGADEILQGFAAALSAGLTLAQLRHTLPVHPTAAEEVVLVR